MKTTRMSGPRKLCLVAGLAMALVFAGCSSNHDNPPAAASNVGTVPDSAGESVAAFLAYIMSLNPDDETSEPALIKDSFAVPPDEANSPELLT